MSKVIQIRNVPDDVHNSLRAAAEAQDVSLTRFILRELEQVAHRAEAVEGNRAVIERTQSQVHSRVGRKVILDALHEGRGE
ncbi:hypothetical protein [Arthrobacter sp. H5]|uniref:FitA-like ribbon-helix-helix domain-containing protein n=1 Tax=Arthrobacter sp. H5 TaxID=1267973 RepID=UPI000488DC51|nr:hypothetical protein [Arthrobacter sp. H5]